MQDENAAKLLAHVMNWGNDLAGVSEVLHPLQLLADYKYDHYQRFAPGRRFIESLALWIDQFDQADREHALSFVRNKLVFFSEEEMSHLVGTAYPDLIVQERMRLVAEESDLGLHRVVEISNHTRFTDLRIKSLYLGLSDGARTNELRRASDGEISNEQIWQAYELGEEKAEDMIGELKKALLKIGKEVNHPLFNIIWLLDDFSGSGNTYIRFDSKSKSFKGKIPKIYDRLTKGDLVDQQHYEVFLLLYVATRQAIDHIEYWTERYTSEKGYKPLQVRVLCVIEPEDSLKNSPDIGVAALLSNEKYNDAQAADEHFRKGGTEDPKMGFAGCALPLVLSHNTPNNSVFVLWGPEQSKFFGLFPRVSRHREF
tara:strand:- start:864397 stop:865506 length:1110 start_codon:yes stop_codon:yes gene_type:complete